MAPMRWISPGRPLTAEERRLVLRAMALIAIPLAVMTLLVGVIGVALVAVQLNDRADETEKAATDARNAAKRATLLTIRLDEEQRERERAIARQAYDNCVENENQDAANVALFRKTKALIAQGPPGRARDELIDALDETSNAREPKGEANCQLPPGANP